MSSGLLALLDDVAAIAKVAAASVDDVAAHAAKASAKSAGVVIDDAAVTPRYVVGFAADRELPIVARIAVGSLRNKLVFLLPLAMLLSLFAPAAITPLLMLGGMFLCYEGAEKIVEKTQGVAPAEGTSDVALSAQALEDEKVTSAIRTDFILSAEIMAIALATLPEADPWSQLAALAIVAVAITAGVYGAVALIVKADDFGLALAARDGALVQWLGRGIVRVMPFMLTGLAGLGTAAMIWVGGGIVVHGLEVFGLSAPAHVISAASAWVAGHAPVLPALFAWVTGALGAGIAGLALGLLLLPAVSHLKAPLLRLFSSR